MTLGCARNDVDSEELAGRLAAGGWTLVEDAAAADVAVVNTCGFVEQAKKDSVDALLEAAELKEDGAARTQAVVAVGCLAQRYGKDLADSLPEADAILGFDSYADLSTQLEGILHGERPASHVPADRRRLLPLAPAARQAAREPSRRDDGTVPVPASGPPVIRARLDDKPWAPLKLASGCDRRCAFCAIPMFRGSFLSRRPTEVLDEARWLAERGVREVFLVSENTTSYGKDLGDIRLLESLLPELSRVDGIDRIRVSYLQPAEVRPGLLEVIAGTEKVVPYFDLSFQHAAPTVLRRMRRFGDTDSFLELIARVRALAPEAGIRSNVIVGFPGETAEDVTELHRFLEAAELDVVGVFGYSDEDGTEAETLTGKLDQATIADRLRVTTDLAQTLMDARAAERVGQTVDVLVEEIDEDDGAAVGRAGHQGPEVDGVVRLTRPVDVGKMVRAVVVDSLGVDLVAEPDGSTPR